MTAMNQAGEPQSSRPEIPRFDPIRTLRAMLGENPSPSLKRRVARSLGEIVGRSPFSISYIENVYSGKMIPGENGKFYKALQAAWTHQRGGHPRIDVLYPVSVWANPEEVPEGTIVLTSARYCEWCGIPFIPRIHNQIFCTPEHRLEAYREKD